MSEELIIKKYFMAANSIVINQMYLNSYKNDEIFKRTEDEHKLKHRKNEEKKPFSWFDSSRRIIKEKVDNRINQFKSNFIQMRRKSNL